MTAIAVLCLSALFAQAADAAAIKVAVAANFTAAAREIAADFKAKTGDGVDLSFGSTGNLYNQIAEGAPFDVFLAADAKRPAKAVAKGLAVKGSAFTYAIGKIALYSRNPKLVAGKQTLTKGTFDKIAIANPKTAPYGAAAVETMKALGVYDRLKARIVQGNNIAQTFQFVSTGNAALGFVALSEIAGSEKGSRWVVPSSYYRPIRQDAVLLANGKANRAAAAFVSFLKGPDAAEVIEKYGYAVGGVK